MVGHIHSDFASARHFRILRKGFFIDENISNQFRHFSFESVKKKFAIKIINLPVFMFLTSLITGN